MDIKNCFCFPWLEGLEDVEIMRGNGDDFLTCDEAGDLRKSGEMCQGGGSRKQHRNEELQNEESLSGKKLLFHRYHFYEEVWMALPSLVRPSLAALHPIVHNFGRIDDECQLWVMLSKPSTTPDQMFSLSFQPPIRRHHHLQ